MVIDAYENNRGIFVNKINAEELIPKKAGKLQRALFIFYVLQLDYATKSQVLYKRANDLFAKKSEFFTPEIILGLSDKELRDILKKYLKPRYINEAVKRYQINSTKLLSEFDGDPRNIFKVRSAKEVLKFTYEFRGFGPKIGNFFIRTMVNVFLYKYEDIDIVSLPVDVHDVKITYLLGYLDSSVMSRKNIVITKNTWMQACKKAKESWLIFDKALWLLGSEGKPKSKEDIYDLLGI